nr:hypothetical protein [Anaerovibrio slackiae]
MNNTGGKVNSKFTQLDNTLDTGNKYLGTYTFFNSEALSKIAFIAKLVDSEKKEKNTCPINK